MNSTYQFNVSIPSRRIFKHTSVKPFKTKSVIGNKVLHCPVGASFTVANDNERTNVHGWARTFGMKFTVRNTPGDTYKRAFRLA